MPPKKAKVDTWCAPTPLEDPPGDINPWPDKNRVPLKSNQKIAFIDEGHLYFIQDRQWAYPDYIISCSKLISYWDTYIKVMSCGDAKDVNPIVQISDALARANRSKSAKLVPKRPDYEGPNVTLIRQMLTTYINTFLEWNVSDPDFNTRAAQLAKCISADTDKSFPHHVQHRTLRLIEVWLLGDIADVHRGAEWTSMLRYIRCPVGGFTNISASCVGGNSLSEFLSAEWEGINGQTPLLPMCAEEASRVPFEIPCMAGTIAHAYLERSFDPSRGPLPVLHEREDVDCLTALLAYLAKNGVTFKPDNIERRVGSRLYKFCGTMDGFREREDGTFEVWDWKRSSKVNTWLDVCTRPFADDPHYLRVDFSKVGFSSNLMTYFIQAAGYRQLELLTNPYKKISTSAFLGVFHPTLEMKFAIVELQLDVKMQKRALNTSKGIGNYMLPNGDLVECASGMTAIEYVQCFLHHRLQHLKKHFGCDPILTS